MKIALLFIILMHSAYFLIAQSNLVPNGSFEDTIQCPTGTGQITRATGWMSFEGTPDYFNSCSSSCFRVPINCHGHQDAFDGDAYSAFIAYGRVTGNAREYIAIQLSQNLIPTQKYYVSFRVSLADTVSFNCAVNKLGALFSTISYSSLPIINFSHMHTDIILSDTQHWQQVHGSFNADSAYQYIIIGNFYDDSLTDTAFCSTPTSSYAYYYLDAVVVSTDSVYADTAFTNLLENVPSSLVNKGLNLSPNPAFNIVSVSSNEIIDEIIIYDFTGKIIYYDNPLTEKINIDISNFNKGIYLVSGRTVNGYYNKKLIIPK